MGPSLFTRTVNSQSMPPGDFAFGAQSQSYSQPPQQRQRLRGISSFFHPFSHAHATGDRSADGTQEHRHSPSKLCQQVDGLPASKSTASLRLKEALSPHRPGVASSPSLISGLPSQNGQASTERVTMTSANLQAQVRRDMPTLASAIHISDGLAAVGSSNNSNVAAERPNKRALRRPSISGPHPLYHMDVSASTASLSLLGSFVDIALKKGHDAGVSESPATKRGRSDSRASNGTINSVRRLSSRLSLENIKTKLSGSLRKRERSTSRGENDRRWSLTNGFGTFTGASTKDPNQISAVSTDAAAAAVRRSLEVRPSMMPMPATRTWRNKFAVNKDRPGTAGSSVRAVRSVAGVGMSGRQSIEKTRVDTTENVERRERYDERTIRRVPVRGRQSHLSEMSLRKSIELQERRASSSRVVVHRAPSLAESIDPAATPKSIPSAHACPSPNVLPVTLTSTSLTATFDSPSPLRPLHTPLSRPHGKHVPATLRAEFFSPAQDDMSILDPARSPLPPSPLVPALPGFIYQSLPPVPPEVSGKAAVERKQSLSELKQAFGRMKEITGLNIDSRAGSRQVSGASGVVPGTNEVESDTAFNLKTLQASLAEIESGRVAELSVKLEDAPSHGTFGPTTESEEALPSLPSSSSARTLYTLPRSKSKSHNDLSTYGSSKNLVEHLETTQGPGWWSVDKRLTKHSSSRTLNEGNAFTTDIEQRLEKLERLARTAQLPCRSTFEDMTEITDSPSPVPRQIRDFGPSDMTGRHDSRPEAGEQLSVMQANPVVKQTHPVDKTTATPKVKGSLQPSTVAPAWRHNHSSPRRAVLARQSMLALTHSVSGDTPTKFRPHQMVVPSSQPPGTASAGGEKTGPFVSSRISPDIARRASFLNRNAASPVPASSRLNEDSYSSPSRSASRSTNRTHLSRSTAPTTVPSDSDEEVLIPMSKLELRSSRPEGPVPSVASEVEHQLVALKARHALELDAILAALGTAKTDNTTLKVEIDSLTKLLAEGVQERERLRETVSRLTARASATSRSRSEEVPPVPCGGMTASDSVASSLLPELERSDTASPLQRASSDELSPSSPIMTDERYPGVDPKGVDEFGRRPLPALPRAPAWAPKHDVDGKAAVRTGLSKGRRVVSVARTISAGGQSDALFEPEREETGDEGWTLRLKEADLEYLDDL
ncbi:hypothetical protein IAU60_004965 [Kwoniella sp. DSM 27419]